MLPCLVACLAGLERARRLASSPWRLGVICGPVPLLSSFFFFNDPAPPEFSPLPLHAALPFCGGRGVPVPEGPPPRPLRRSIGRGRHGVRRDRADHRTDLGEDRVGHVVGLGRAPHLHAVPLFPLYRLPAAARGRRGRGGARPLCRRARHLRHGAGAVHPPERVPVSDAPSATHHPQAERALTAAEHARDLAALVRGVHRAVCRVRDAALRAGTGPRGGRRWLTRRTTRVIWPPPTSRRRSSCSPTPSRCTAAPPGASRRAASRRPAARASPRRAALAPAARAWTRA